jgi:hypothetical protein
MTQTESLAVQLADHNARIEALESSVEQARADHRRLGDKLDAMQTWIMGTLAAALLGAAMQLVKMLTTK